MKKLLYISVNSKAEELSASKTVAREFINRFLNKNTEFVLEELDLYKTHIPRLEHQYFESRNCLVNEECAKSLSEKDRAEIQTIRALCDQFISADLYVIAVPMWSILFPAPLKEYIDCILQDQKTLSFNDKSKPKGLLDDKARTLVYIQSSGAQIPLVLEPFMNKGGNYIEAISKVIGISDFKQLLVDGTGYTKEEQSNAVDDAISQVDSLIDKINI